jgi:hypothetical protein
MTSNEIYNGGEKKWRLIQPSLPFTVPSQLGGSRGTVEGMKMTFYFYFYLILF